MGDVTGSVLSKFQEEHGGHPLQLRLHPSAKCGPPQVIPLDANDTSEYNPVGPPDIVCVFGHLFCPCILKEAVQPLGRSFGDLGFFPGEVTENLYISEIER